MQTYDELAELARLCANNARTTINKETAAGLWGLARKYQEKAAKLKGAEGPDIGTPPPWVPE